MHPETLKRIEELVAGPGLEGAIARTLDNTKIGFTPALVLPDGKIVDCEPYALARARPRGTFTTHSIGAFARFLGEQGEKVPVLVDITSLSATAILDHGALDSVVQGNAPQGHCKFVAKVQARAAAPWDALRKTAAPPIGPHKPVIFSQRALAEWLVDWRGYITGAWQTDMVPAVTDEPPMTVAQAATAIRNVKIKTEGEQTSAISGLAREAAAKESLRIEGEGHPVFPTGFRFLIEPYVGFRWRRIDVRLNNYIAQDKSEPPTFGLQIIGYDALVEELANEFADLIREVVPQERADVLLGTFAT